MGKDKKEKRKSEGGEDEEREDSWDEKIRYLCPIAAPLASRKLTKRLYKTAKKGKSAGFGVFSNLMPQRLFWPCRLLQTSQFQKPDVHTQYTGCSILCLNGLPKLQLLKLWFVHKQAAANLCYAGGDVCRYYPGEYVFV